MRRLGLVSRMTCNFVALPPVPSRRQCAVAWNGSFAFWAIRLRPEACSDSPSTAVQMCCSSPPLSHRADMVRYCRGITSRNRPRPRSPIVSPHFATASPLVALRRRDPRASLALRFRGLDAARPSAPGSGSAPPSDRLGTWWQLAAARSSEPASRRHSNPLTNHHRGAALSAHTRISGGVES